MQKRFFPLFFGCVLIFSVAAGAAFGGENTPKKKSRRSQETLKITGTAVGPTIDQINAAEERVLKSDAVQRELVGKKFRLFGLQYIDNGTPNPTNFQVTLYDYSNDRTLVAEGDFDGKTPVTIRQEFSRPIVNNEEFQEAVDLIRKDPTLGPELTSRTVNAFRPMPDVTILEGTTERLVNVGLTAKDANSNNEIVGVSIKTGVVIRYPNGAPSAAVSTPDACGIPNAFQNPTNRGTNGTANLTVTDGVNTLWEMTITRPSASIGTRASGIDLQNIKYKGKLVLKRANTPILNVQYVGGQCGPYRDWQYNESPFQTPASGNNDITTGIRIVAPGQVASTSLENGTDLGNFAGVAIYTDSNNEVVLVSEMEAGWYRYIVEYRFATDGTIRPRFGFGATDNSCVCFAHNHHVYWRFDFDIVNSANRVYQVERGKKFLQPLLTETNRNKSVSTNRSLLIQNSTGNEAYMLVPNLFDGVVDTFGGHDFWVLRYKNVVGGTPLQNEIDDGINCTTCSTAFVQLDPFANNESIVNQDVVVWYGAHFLHSDGANLMDPSRHPTVLSGDHVVGPDLRPVRW